MRVLLLCLSFVSLFASASYIGTKLPAKLMLSIKSEYGSDAYSRARSWQRVLNENYPSDKDKIEAVNQFFNKVIKYKTDLEHWKKDDYWATPVESIGTEHGDCEDYAIAKILTLQALGIDPAQLRLMYVRALDWNEAHMVAIYYEDLSQDNYPLVMDNLIPEVKYADTRTDLQPIYSFNGQGLWLAKAKGLGNDVSNGERFDKWIDLMNKIEQEAR